MNKSAVKNYAVEARKKWIQAIAQQAAFYGCTEKGSLNEADITKQLADKGVFLTANEKSARGALVNDINEKGYQNAIEEIAYTWFNRLIAIRFMEVNGYLPSGIRVLSSIDADRIEPDCVREYARLDFLNQDTAAKLAAESDEKLYRYILVEQCNALGKIMPKMFTHIGGIAALLLPERLYIKDGLVHDLTHIKDVEESDFGEQIETIGWLYQYYISEKKDEVFAALKKNVKITRENIPAATQLFTPDWIVKYMVENSLGRLWLEQLETQKTFDFNYVDFGNFSFGEDEDKSITKKQQALKDNWKYYIDEAPQEEAVQKQLYDLRMSNKSYDITKIRLIDPCMGSGHILVYAFDVLYQIYLSQGYSERDIPDLILDNNIYGLDIDERACQLAYFALMMKARSYNRRFFRREDVPQPQVYSPQGYEDGMEYGSLLKVDALEEKPLEKEAVTLFDTPYEVELNTWNFRRLLHQKYDVVVTNPPYMGSSGMSATLGEYVKNNFPISKSDMFSVFIEKCGQMLKSLGYQSMITMESWMFLSSFEKLREKKFAESTIINLVHMPYLGKGGTSLGINFGTSAFIIQNHSLCDYNAQYVYIRYFETDDDGIPFEFPVRNYRYCTNRLSNYQKIEGSPIVYSSNDKLLPILQGNKHLYDLVDITGSQHKTANNEKYLRNIWEVDATAIGDKWITYSKGGAYRKWWGNIELVVDWSNNAQCFYKTNPTSNFIKKEYQFREGLTWTATTNYAFSLRVLPPTGIFDIKGPAMFPYKSNDAYFILGLMNSSAIYYILKMFKEGSDYQNIEVKRVPIADYDSLTKQSVNGLVSINISNFALE